MKQVFRHGNLSLLEVHSKRRVIDHLDGTGVPQLLNLPGLAVLVPFSAVHFGEHVAQHEADDG